MIDYGADCNIIMDTEWSDAMDEKKGMHALTQASLAKFSRCLKLLIPHVNRMVLETTAVMKFLSSAE